MKAVIVTGGKQYTVAEGDVVFVEKLGAEAEATVKFDQVLAVLDGENTKIPLWRVPASRPRSSRTARARRSTSSATSPRRTRRSTSVIASLTPRWRSPRSLCNL